MRHRTAGSEFKTERMQDTQGKWFRTRSGLETKWVGYLWLLYRGGLISKFTYEPKEFIFTDIKRGRGGFYKPDFYIEPTIGPKFYQECKGELDAVSYTKISRFCLKYPEDAQGFELIMQTTKKTGPELARLDKLRPIIAGVHGRIVDARECLRNLKR